MKTPPFVPRWPPFTFGGVENPGLEESRVVVVPVPFDSTASYRAGSRNGAEAIIDASRFMELYDVETDSSPIGIGVHTARGIEPDRDPERMLRAVRNAASEIISLRKFPVFLGGEHTITVGVVEAFASSLQEITVLVFDAHLDLRDEYEGSRLSHACTNRRIRERAKHTVILGARSCSEEEHESIDAEGLDCILWSEGDREGSLSRMVEAVESLMDSNPGPVYLSIDLDVLNPAEMPAVGTPEPSGISYDELLPLLRRIAGSEDLVGFDIMELAPLDGDVRGQFIAAKILYKLLAYRFGSQVA